MADEAILPFRVTIHDDVIWDLRDRLARTRWPDQLSEDHGWDLGCDRTTLRTLCDAWQHYDVEDFVRRINEFAQFTTVIDGQTIHFLHVRSPRADAQPLIITHGWPGSVWEFHKIIGTLTNPDDPKIPAFHVVCPSIPGYGFSGPTFTLGWDVARVARAEAVLMARLGYDRYGAQGGDWGAIITSHLGAHDPKHCVAIHINMVAAGPPDPSNPVAGVLPDEMAGVMDGAAFREHGAGYQEIQKTKPQTLSYGLTDSPAGLAGWILEKFHAWGDLTPTNGGVLARFGLDTLCANLSIYWFTGTINASTRMYFETIGPGRRTPMPTVPVPTACALFPKEIYRAPRVWADAQYPHIERWTVFSQGGHFAALEEPDALVADLRAFFTPDRFTG